MNMSRIKKILLVIFIVFIAIQFVQPGRNKSLEITASDISRTINIPDSVKTLLKHACYDCHSNYTDYPWYAYVQPLGWILSDHIQKGKKELNFSEFGSYTHRKQLSKLKATAGQVNENKMPLSSYKWMHSNARLTKDEKALIIKWTELSKDRLSIEKINE